MYVGFNMYEDLYLVFMNCGGVMFLRRYFVVCVSWIDECVEWSNDWSVLFFFFYLYCFWSSIMFMFFNFYKNLVYKYVWDFDFLFVLDNLCGMYLWFCFIYLCCWNVLRVVFWFFVLIFLGLKKFWGEGKELKIGRFIV